MKNDPDDAIRDDETCKAIKHTAQTIPRQPGKAPVLIAFALAILFSKMKMSK
jgi:hypothetical protein